MSKILSRAWSPAGPVSKAFVESPAEVKIYVAPVGAGKTSAAVASMLMLASLQRPSADGIRYSRFVITRATQQRLLSSTLPSAEEWLGGIGTIRRTSPIEKHIRTADLSIQIDFVAIDDAQATERIYGSNVSAIILDEARELPDLRATLGMLITRAGRFPQGGPSYPTRAILISNPSPSGHDLHTLCMNPPQGFEIFLAPPALLPDRVTPNPNAENIHNLNSSYYRTLARTMPPDRIAVELMMEWAVMQEGKPLVPEFRSSTHVSRTSIDPPRGMPLLIGLDPGVHPAAVIGAPIETERGEVRWELFAELTGSNIVKFAGTLKDFVARRFPGNPVEQVFIDPSAYHPSDREDEKLIAELYASITGWKVKAPNSNLVDVQIEALRGPFGMLVDGAPAILIDPSCQTLIAALAGKVCYREATSGLEKVTTDQIKKVHPWHDVFMAASYLLLGGGGYANLRGIVTAAKKKGRETRGTWSPRIGKFVDERGVPLQNQMSGNGGPRIADGMDYDFFNYNRE